jgi:uncharacterized NAD(P)/FAD-binding protein YdhS
VDVTLSLTGSGVLAPIHAVSRHGLLPLSHVDTPVPGPEAGAPPVSGLGALIRYVRARAGTGDWRSTVDGLRPYANSVWSGLSHVERERFVRHVVRVWEVHRHRMAPPVAALIEGLRTSGALTVRAGTVAAVTGDGELLRAGALRVGTVVNCRGPAGVPTTGLGRALLAAGLGRPAGVGPGLDVDAEGRLVDAAGRPSDRVFVIGPPRRGSWWETTAVPEIRAQARELALLVAGSARPGAPLPAAALAGSAARSG